MNIFNRKGQYLAEYAIIFSLVLAALIGMQTYVKRGLQGKYRDATVFLTDRVGSALQYEPYYAESKIRTTARQNITETVISGGSRTITIPEDDPNTTERAGTQTILSGLEAD